MHVLVPRKPILALLKIAIGVADPKSAMPVLGTIKITANAEDLSVSVTATDLYRSVHGTLIEGIVVNKPGGIALPAKALLERIEAMPEGPVDILVEEDVKATITSGVRKSLRFKMTGLAASEYPNVAEPPKDTTFVNLPTSSLRLLLNRTLFAVSRDLTRPHVSSLNFEINGDVIRGVATDGHRLCRMDITVPDLDAKVQVLVPLAGAEHLRKIVDEAAERKEPIVFGVGGPNVFFSAGGIRYSVKSIDEKYMPYEQAIPKKQKYNLVMPCAAFATALKAAVIAASDADASVKLSFNKDLLTVSAHDASKGEASDTIAIDYAGKDFDIFFYCPYLLQALTALDCDEIEFMADGPQAAPTKDNPNPKINPVTMKPRGVVKGQDYVTMVVGQGFNS